MTLSAIIDATPPVELPATNVTAIQDRLILGLQEAKKFLELSLDYETVQISVNASPPASTVISVWINDEKIDFTSDADPTPIEIAGGLVTAINLSGQEPVVTATDNADGTYTVVTDTPGTTFEIYPDPFQDIVPIDLNDVILATEISVAKQLADAYTNNPFETSAIVNGVIVVSDAAIPEAVKVGVLQLLRSLHDDASNKAVASGPVKIEKAGDIRIEYETSKSAEELGGSVLPQMVRAILDMYRFIPGI